ncbi:MAG: gliding motility-associated C-terminal domain-containing protein [Chitinophagales bacterium]
MKRYKGFIQSFFVLLFLFLGGNNLVAQIFVNNGAQVTVTDNALVGVLGSLQNGTAAGPTNGNIDNAGYVWIDGDCINLANHNISGLDAASLNSVFVVKGNWDNSGVFNAFQSTVELDTSIEQLITGTSITTFHNLSLKGSLLYNLKRQTIDAFIDPTGTLQILDAELATDNSLMQVLNPDNGAVVASDGFVSSLGDAYISWTTNSTDLYEFPVGSSLGTLRKRVVQLTPGSANANVMGVRMANVDATSENYNRDDKEDEICEINPFFYHRIYQLSGNDNMDIGLQYVSAEEGNWDIMVNWENNPAREWSYTENSFASPTFVSVANWTAFSDTSFAFGRRLEATMVANPSSVCPGDTAQITISSGINSAAILSWLQPVDPSLPSGPVTLPLTFDVMPTQTTVYTVEVTSNGCVITLEDTIIVETPSNLSIVVTPNPVLICEGESVTFFADTSGGGPTGEITWYLNAVEQIGQNADTFVLVNGSQGDLIRATYSTQAGCSGEVSSDLVMVNTTSGITAELTGADIICVPEGQNIPLFVTVDAPNGSSFDVEWSSEAELSCVLGCTGTFAQPVVGDSIYVYVTITPIGNETCPIRDSVLICAIDVPGLYVPSAFTPNGDNDNDLLAILGDLDEFDLDEFRIYNRWGELLFETNDFSVGWNGTYKGEDQELDVYVYYLKATSIETGEKTDKEGHITLIR